MHTCPTPTISSIFFMFLAYIKKMCKWQYHLFQYARHPSQVSLRWNKDRSLGLRWHLYMSFRLSNKLKWTIILVTWILDTRTWTQTLRLCCVQLILTWSLKINSNKIRCSVRHVPVSDMTHEYTSPVSIDVHYMNFFNVYGPRISINFRCPYLESDIIIWGEMKRLNNIAHNTSDSE